MKIQHITAAAILALAASAAQAQSIQLTGGVRDTGCNNGNFGVDIRVAGLSTADWSAHTTVDIGAHRYSDDLEPFVGGLPDGDTDVYLMDDNDTGTQTHPFPLPPGTPFRVTVTTYDAAHRPVYRSSGTVTPGCDDQHAEFGPITHTALPGPGVASVPTLGHAALGLLGAMVGGWGLRARRRQEKAHP